MITVTDRAATELRELLVANNASRGQAVKLAPDANSNVSMSIGTAGEHDQVISDGEDVLLIVDRRLVSALDGAQVDCETAIVEGQPKTEFRLLAPS